MESMYLLVIACGVFAEVMIVVSFVNTVKDFDRDSEGKLVKSSKESFFTKFLASTLRSFF